MRLTLLFIVTATGLLSGYLLYNDDGNAVATDALNTELVAPKNVAPLKSEDTVAAAAHHSSSAQYSPELDSKNDSMTPNVDKPKLDTRGGSATSPKDKYEKDVVARAQKEVPIELSEEAEQAQHLMDNAASPDLTQEAQSTLEQNEKEISLWLKEQNIVEKLNKKEIAANEVWQIPSVISQLVEIRQELMSRRLARLTQDIDAYQQKLSTDK